MPTPFHHSNFKPPPPSPTSVTMEMTKCISYACMSLCGLSAQGRAAGEGGKAGRVGCDTEMCST